MTRKKMKRFRAYLSATLPASASMEFEAENQEAAQKYADEHSHEADWDGADSNRPQGCDIEVYKVEELP